MKGIDVQLAIDFVAGAIDGDYDVGVIASTDTDLIPAIDFVVERFGGIRSAQVAAWSSDRFGPRLQTKIPSTKIWCHYLRRSDYDSIADPTDYVRP